MLSSVVLKRDFGLTKVSTSRKVVGFLNVIIYKSDRNGFEEASRIKESFRAIFQNSNTRFTLPVISIFSRKSSLTEIL